jgi:hypothetical protein
MNTIPIFSFELLLLFSPFSVIYFPRTKLFYVLIGILLIDIILTLKLIKDGI